MSAIRPLTIVSNSDGTLTISPTVGLVVASLNLGHANTWSAQQTLTNPIVGTQSASDNSTKAASTAYVTSAISTAIAGVNPAVAVQAATTAASDTSGFTYTHVAGIGDFFTGSVNTPVIIDGYTFTALGQRLLVKNDTQNPSGAFNGIYYVTQIQTALLAPILTRALDYDTPSDINNTGAIPVVNGTVNANTSWLLTSTVNTVGTDPLTYVQFSLAPSTIITTSTSAGGDLTGTYPNPTIAKIQGTTVSGTSGSVNVAFTTSPTFTTPILGTPTSGTLTNCTGLSEAGLTLANNTTNNVSTSKHGFAPILPNDATKFLNGTGVYSVPGGGLTNNPACRCTNSISQTIHNASATALTFDTNSYDTASLHSTSVNTSRLTASQTGIWKIFGGVEMSTSGSQLEQLLIKINGTTFIAAETWPAISNSNIDRRNITTDYKLNSGDFVELFVYQNSGGDLSATASSDYAPIFGMALISN